MYSTDQVYLIPTHNNRYMFDKVADYLYALGYMWNSHTSRGHKPEISERAKRGASCILVNLSYQDGRYINLFYHSNASEEARLDIFRRRGVPYSYLNLDFLQGRRPNV